MHGSNGGRRPKSRRRVRGKKGNSAPDVLTRRMHLFLDTARDWALGGKSMTLKDIAEACGLHWNRPSKWIRHPAFRRRKGPKSRD